MDHRPSAIAAAATLMALDQRLTKKALECKMNPISYCGFLEIVSTFCLYLAANFSRLRNRIAYNLIKVLEYLFHRKMSSHATA